MSYRTIVADPPWPMEWSGGRTTAGRTSGSTRVYEKRAMPYRTMAIDEIAALPVRDLAAADAYLFLWAIDRFVVDGSAAAVCRAWGFEPTNGLLVWRKRSAGLGRFIRPAHELIVVARRGAARLTEISTTSVHSWRQPYRNGAKVHSAKPEQMQDLVERLSPGPYLELFARRPRFGWHVWGDEVDSDVELLAEAA